MKPFHSLPKAAAILTGAVVVFCFAEGCKPAAAPPSPKPAAATAKTVVSMAAPAPAADAYVSVFEDLLPPKGRDPFFPDSHRREPAPPPAAPRVAHSAPVASDLLLKGIVGSATHRLAVINNQIFEVGEEAPVRVTAGQLRVKCLEIGEDYAVVQVEGEARAQRLEMDKK